MPSPFNMLSIPRTCPACRDTLSANATSTTLLTKFSIPVPNELIYRMSLLMECPARTTDMPSPMCARTSLIVFGISATVTNTDTPKFKSNFLSSTKNPFRIWTKSSTIKCRALISGSLVQSWSRRKDEKTQRQSLAHESGYARMLQGPERQW